MKRINMLEGNIDKVLIGLAWPIILTNLIQTALGIVDMIFIAKLGSNAVTAIGSASFLMNTALSLTALIVTGTSVLVAQNLGKQREKEAASVFKNALIMSVLISLVYGFIVYKYSENVLIFLKIDDPVIIKMALDYLMHSLPSILLIFLTNTFTSVLTSHGKTQMNFKANSIGLLTNIILDPLFIFGYKKWFPSMGIAGAAWASNIARFLTLILLIYASKEELNESKESSTDFSLQWHMFKLGLPVASQKLFFTFISMMMARIIVDFGTDVIAAQRIGVQIESISYVTIGGLQSAVSAFIGQNYGANNLERVKGGYKHSLKLILYFSIPVTLIFLLFPRQLYGVFINEAMVIEHGILYMRAIAYSQFFMCLEILTVGAFHGLGRTHIPSFVSSVLTLARIPMAILLSQKMGISGVWWSISLSSIFKGLTLWIWYELMINKELKGGNKHGSSILDEGC